MSEHKGAKPVYLTFERTCLNIDTSVRFYGSQDAMSFRPYLGLAISTPESGASRVPLLLVSR